MEGADVVHVRVDVGVRRVKRRLRPHRGVPLGRDPDEGNVGESRAACEAGRPGKRERRRWKEKKVSPSLLINHKKSALQFIKILSHMVETWCKCVIQVAETCNHWKQQQQVWLLEGPEPADKWSVTLSLSLHLQGGELAAAFRLLPAQTFPQIKDGFHRCVLI